MERLRSRLSALDVADTLYAKLPPPRAGAPSASLTASPSSASASASATPSPARLLLLDRPAPIELSSNAIAVERVPGSACRAQSRAAFLAHRRCKRWTTATARWLLVCEIPAERLGGVARAVRDAYLHLPHATPSSRRDRHWRRPHRLLMRSCATSHLCPGAPPGAFAALLWPRLQQCERDGDFEVLDAPVAAAPRPNGDEEDDRDNIIQTLLAKVHELKALYASELRRNMEIHSQTLRIESEKLDMAERMARMLGNALDSNSAGNSPATGVLEHVEAAATAKLERLDQLVKELNHGQQNGGGRGGDETGEAADEGPVRLQFRDGTVITVKGSVQGGGRAASVSSVSLGIEAAPSPTRELRFSPERLPFED